MSFVSANSTFRRFIFIYNASIYHNRKDKNNSNIKIYKGKNISNQINYLTFLKINLDKYHLQSESLTNSTFSQCMSFDNEYILHGQLKIYYIYPRIYTIRPWQSKYYCVFTATRLTDCGIYKSVIYISDIPKSYLVPISSLPRPCLIQGQGREEIRS